MKIIQSFWSKPHYQSSIEAVDSRLHGGWPAQKYYYMSWAMSCLQLCKFYDEVELVTDQTGFHLLIDQLQLPYTKVTIALDALNGYPAELWALGKIYTYSLQDKPFLHVDSDLFIWEPFSERLIEQSLIAQHLEVAYPFYASLYEMVHKHFTYIPDAIQRHCNSGMPINAYNMGIAGGYDIGFFQQYTGEAFKFVHMNSAPLSKGTSGSVNTLFEQVLFYCMAGEGRRQVHLYTNTTGEEAVDNELKGFGNFCLAPSNGRLIHLYGNCKMNNLYCEELENQIRKSYPQYYHRISALDKQNLIIPTNNGEHSLCRF